jgi:hypothetical protein
MYLRRTVSLLHVTSRRHVAYVGDTSTTKISLSFIAFRTNMAAILLSYHVLTRFCFRL